VTATRIEFNAVARALQLTHPVSQFGFRALSSHAHGLHILLIQSGIGPGKARTITKQILTGTSWDILISTGFAGDLESDSIGSVLIGHEVFFGQDPTSHLCSTPQSIRCHPDWVKTALSVSCMGAKSLRTGRFVSVDRVLTRSVDKQKLRASTGAVGVDMESATIGEIAQKYGIPFLIIRTISDGLREDLPVDFNLFLKPSGWLAGVMHIMLTPSSWKGFLDLYRHSKQASLQLTQFFEEFIAVVSTMPTSPNSITMKS
jgi:adenosylhomocysteine nucleosidase